MRAIGKPEYHTQNRVIAFFRDELKGHYSADNRKQSEEADVLNERDWELAGLEQRQEKTCALKQAMMYEVLIGRPRLV